MKLVNILNEIVIQKPVPNNLRKLEALEAQFKQSNSREEKKQLALQAAELVLPIYEFYYPGDTRVRDTLNAAKEGRYDSGAWKAYKESDIPAAKEAAYAAFSHYIDDVIDSAIKATNYAAFSHHIDDVIDSAIKATKLHFKLK